MRWILLALACTTLFAQTRYLPHITRSGGGFATTINLVHSGSSEGSVSFRCFDAAGTLLSSVNRSLQPGQFLQESAATLFGSSSVAWAELEGDADILVSAAYQAVQGRGSAAHVATTNEISHSFQLHSGNWSEVFDGLALVNVDLQATAVYLDHHDQTGGLLKRVTLTEALQPRQKLLYVLGDPSGSPFTPAANSHFVLRAEQNLVVTALRGTTLGSSVGFLWENQAPALLPPALKDLVSFPIGMAVQPWNFRAGEPRIPILERHFNVVVAENEMKPGPIHPGADSYFWTDADKIVDAAAARGMQIHGHVLVWHEQVPSWMNQFSGSQQQWEAMLKSHIQTVVGRYKGRVSSWDVVNEAFLDDGSPRNTIWQQHIPDYIALAFEWAHQADPAALLYYNDYNLEGLPAKRNAVLAMIDSLRGRNPAVPIHGLGLQMHLQISWPAVSELSQALQAAAARGLLVRYSELDVRLNPQGTLSAVSDELLLQQKERYRDLVAAYLQLPPSLRGGITLWGLRDTDTWIQWVFQQTDWPLLFDDNYQAKPAFYGFAEGLTP
jgi:endo-1,4-beta-xylanase